MSDGQAYILGMKVDATSYEEASQAILEWSIGRASRYVCFAPVNNAVEAYDSVAYRRAINGSDLTTPDGMPLVWGLKLLGHPQATRVYGPDITTIVLRKAADARIPVGFYGSTPAVVGRLCDVARNQFPSLKIAYEWSPPFRPLTPEEDAEVVAAINGSGARILFIGLSSPAQDFWMAAHKGRVEAVMLGVGAAFDFISGTKPQAPRWMMRIGMEWLFRLITEPRRLWKRYLKQNPRFLILFTAQLLGWKEFPR
jgi:N-acetylglucosaminyldiphosphoundecaprenol N-acetyl-beta-D-mannosaminyltransferase